VVATRIRRTKLEGGVGRTVESSETARRRSGKRVFTYATESVKLIRRCTTRGWRVSTFPTKRDGSRGQVGVTTATSSLQAYEYPVLVRLATTGLLRLVNANDRVGIYVAVEWLSLSLYVMAAFRRGSAYSTEAGLKYYVVGSFGSAWMLLGMALVYGWTGTFNRLEVERRRTRSSYSDGGREWVLYRIGWQLVIGAVLVKLAGVPLHRWLADVYEGAPMSSVLYFAVVPKLALFTVRVRRVSVWYVQADATLASSAVVSVTKRRRVVSVRSMAVGAIGALTQRRMKRFRAYSAIGHTGYILLGVMRGTTEGVQGVRVYSMVYRVMTRVMWQRRMVVKVYEKAGTGVIRVREVKYRTDRYQLGKENPALSRRIARTAMSMAGVPPIAGFAAKRAVFRALMDSSYYRVGARAVRRSVIGAFNYLRRVKRMYFEEGRQVTSDQGTVIVRKAEEVTVRMTKGLGRRRGREGRWRTTVRRHPTGVLLRTHRMALELVSL
jgi:proton-translocating NADH-quinone oxidoreductase chain N